MPPLQISYGVCLTKIIEIVQAIIEGEFFAVLYKSSTKYKIPITFSESN